MREIDYRVMVDGLADAIREACVPAILLFCNNGRYTNARRWELLAAHEEAHDHPHGSADQGFVRTTGFGRLVEVRLLHFQLLFEQAEAFGQWRFRHLFITLAGTAVLAYSCTRKEVVEWAMGANFGWEGRQGRQIGRRVGIWGSDLVGFIDQSWDRAVEVRLGKREIDIELRPEVNDF